jgi:hypothetical protein
MSSAPAFARTSGQFNPPVDQTNCYCPTCAGNIKAECRKMEARSEMPATPTGTGTRTGSKGATTVQ